MTAEYLNPIVKSWLKGTDVEPPEPKQAAREVMALLHKVRRRGRWWPLPSLHRSPAPAPAIPSTEFKPTPIPATNGHSVTVTGRTQFMFSPAKAIAAGALVFALGGVMLIAQPFDQQGSGVPGAETEAIAPTRVSGEHALASSCTGPEIEFEDDVRHERNRVCSPQTWTFSDPRLSGEVAAVWNEDIYQTDDGAITVHVRADFLRNDGGEWTCSSTSLVEGISLTGATSTCVGQGGYDGLSAVLVETDDRTGLTWVGLIFAGDFPPLPEAPPVE